MQAAAIVTDEDSTASFIHSPVTSRAGFEAMASPRRRKGTAAVRFEQGCHAQVRLPLAIAPTSAPKYGTINGYTVVENGSFSTKAMVISQWLNDGVLSSITSNNVLQFNNVDTGGALHSAVGFRGASFPSVPYTFPSAAASPVATAVSTGALWSTGRINAPTYQQCYSQTFTLKPGVYYFGDLDYYNLSNFRDPLIVATAGPTTITRRTPRSIR